MKTVYQIVDSIDKKVVEATYDALMEAALDIQVDYFDVVRDWKNKPIFKVSPTEETRYIEMLILPTGRNAKVFTYVDMGTGKYGKNHMPYLIIPKNPNGLLKFQTGYNARTMPIAKANVGTGLSTGAWVTNRFVNHPGIKPRKFSETFAEELDPPLEKRVNLAIKRVL